VRKKESRRRVRQRLRPDLRKALNRQDAKVAKDKVAKDLVSLSPNVKEAKPGSQGV
jgi:hypothetical protein